jgi:hypothetical protein
VYVIARREGLSQGWAVATVLLLGIASPWLAYSRSFLTEPLSGLLLAAGLLAARGQRWALAGVAVSLAMAMKAPFAVFGAGWMLVLLAQRRWREGLVLTASLGVGGLALLLFNRWVSHVWVVGGRSGWMWASGLRGFKSTLLHPSYGLLIFVPWAALAVLALVPKGWAQKRGLAPTIGVPLLLYLAVLSASKFTGGNCYGPRYWVPALPFLALLVIDVAKRRLISTVALAVLAAWGLYLTLPGALRYKLVWDQPPSVGWPAWTGTQPVFRALFSSNIQ